MSWLPSTNIPSSFLRSLSHRSLESRSLLCLPRPDPEHPPALLQPQLACILAASQISHGARSAQSRNQMGAGGRRGGPCRRLRLALRLCGVQPLQVLSSSWSGSGYAREACAACSIDSRLRRPGCDQPWFGTLLNFPAHRSIVQSVGEPTLGRGPLQVRYLVRITKRDDCF